MDHRRLSGLAGRSAFRRGVENPWRLIALAVVAQAVTDWRRGSRGARSWLFTDGLTWLDGCGLNVDPDYWQMWVLSGCRGYKRKETLVTVEKKKEGKDEY